MADRVKYFLLGLLFLVVAGVIAYDRWNADPVSRPGTDEEMADRGVAEVGPEEPPPAPGPGGLAVRPFQDPGAPDITPPEPGPLPPSPRDLTPPPPQPGPERVVPKPPAPEPTPAPPVASHVVQPGETLEIIALKYYKTRDGIAWIAEANGIRNVNHIQAKQKLILPARKESARGSREAPAEGGARTARKVPDVYVVKSGEDLYDICRRFYGTKGEGARVAQIMELNNLWSADVRTGTKLTLPRE